MKWFKVIKGPMPRKVPGDELREKERGTLLAEPEQTLVELLPQINGFPATLKRKTKSENMIWKKKVTGPVERGSGKKWYLNVLAGNLGTGPLRLL